MADETRSGAREEAEEGLGSANLNTLAGASAGEAPQDPRLAGPDDPPPARDGAPRPPVDDARSTLEDDEADTGELAVPAGLGDASGSAVGEDGEDREAPAPHRAAGERLPPRKPMAEWDEGERKDDDPGVGVPPG